MEQVTKSARVLKVDERDGTFVARASDNQKDRDGDIVHPEGFMPGMATFMANGGSISAFHQWNEFAIGKVMDFAIDPQRFDFEGKWAPTGRGQEARVLYEGGFQKGFSVGMDPKKAEPIFDDDTGMLSGFEFFQQDLLEVAAVLVNANSRAHLLSYSMKNYGMIPTMQRAGLLDGADIQAVLVPKSKMKRDRAQLFVREHGFSPDKCMHVGDEFFQFVQFDVDEGAELKTVPWLDDSRLVIAAKGDSSTRREPVMKQDQRVGWNRRRLRPDTVFHAKADGMSDNELRDQLERALWDAESDVDYLYAEAVFEDTVVYRVRYEEDGSEPRLLERDYSVSGDTVTVGDSSAEVRRVVRYVPVGEAGADSSEPETDKGVSVELQEKSEVRTADVESLQSGVESLSKRVDVMETRLKFSNFRRELADTIRRAERIASDGN